MSLSAYNPTGVPQHTAILNDRGGITAPVSSSEKVTVLGCNNRTDIELPLFQPYGNSSLTNQQLLNLAKNKNAVTGELYASELSIAISELQASGYSNIELIRIGDHDRLTDTESLHATHRYIMLENAYSALIDLSVDIILSCNLFMGLKGDGSYNALEWEYVFDASKTTADPGFPKYFRLTSATDGTEFNKGARPGLENLTYQLPDFCFTSTRHNESCFGVVSALDTNRFKFLTKHPSADTWRISGGASSSGAVTGGSAITFSNLNSADGVDDATIGQAIRDALFSLDPEYMHPSYPTVKINSLIESANSAQELFNSLESSSYFNATYTAATAAEKAAFEFALLKWNMLHGTPTAAELSLTVAHNENFGASTFDVNGFNTGAGEAIASFSEYDSRTSTTGKFPDNFLMFATTQHSPPLSRDDSSIIFDQRGTRVDLGSYMEVLFPHSLGTTSELAAMRPTNPTSRVSSLAAQLKLHESTPSYNAITNLPGPGIRPIANAQLSKTQAGRLARARIQCFFSKSNGYVLSDGMTGAMNLNEAIRSDYVRAMTRDITFEWADNVRAIGDPFSGKGKTAVNVASLEQKLGKRMDEFKERGALIDGSVVLINDNAASSIGQLRVRSTLVTPDEIREIVHEMGITNADA